MQQQPKNEIFYKIFKLKFSLTPFICPHNHHLTFLPSYHLTMPRNPEYFNHIPKAIADIDFHKLVVENGPYFPSPANWEDEVLYFMMVDRFSNGREFGNFRNDEGEEVIQTDVRDVPPLQSNDRHSADPATWFESGRGWCGGNLIGVRDKLGYLKRLGVTVIWLSPVFKQTHNNASSYHGYGVQNFFDIDPHFGTREELKALVAEAHRLGIRIILDIILNHAGDVFAYQDGLDFPYQNGRQWPVNGYRTDDTDRIGTLPFEVIDLEQYPDAWPHGAVWPRELQKPDTWKRQGSIQASDWDRYPAYTDGDFFSLKDINMGTADSDPAQAWDLLQRIRQFRKSQTLVDLCRIFQYWIAYADIDGFRVDTVKHMEPGAVRYFCNVIHEFAQLIGKENFYIIGEVTGGRTNAVNIVDTTGLDAGLGIDDIQEKLEFLAKGRWSPGNPETGQQEGYFDLFANSLADGKNSHQWFSKRIITMFDDHDQVGTTYKYRFCGQPGGAERLHLAMALNLLTLGIPCTYYGTEQGLDGADPRGPLGSSAYSDVFLRECMFGGPFGAFRSTGKHVFDESNPYYQTHAALCTLRQQHMALRRGRQYLRKVSDSGQEGTFYYPELLHGEILWVIAWSRVFADRELICAINTDSKSALQVWIAVDEFLHPEGTALSCLFSTDTSQIGSRTTVKPINRAAIQITVPACGVVVWGKPTL